MALVSPIMQVNTLRFRKVQFGKHVIISYVKMPVILSQVGCLGIGKANCL